MRLARDATLLLPLWVTLQSVTGTDPCTGAQTIDERFRSAAYEVIDKAYDNLLCDRLLTPGWYRFAKGNGHVGYTTMAKGCQKTYHCGTHLPMSMQGSDPSVAEGIVDRTVCAPDLLDSDCCDYTGTIRAVNCSTFIAYYLEPTYGCHYAYCTDSQMPCPVGMIGTPPNCTPAYPKMLQSPTLSPPVLDIDTFHFTCTINFDPSRRDVGFDVEWLFDGRPDPKVAAVHITDGVTRSTDLVVKHDVLYTHMGKDVQCKVSTHFLNSSNRKSPFIVSNPYTPAIQMSTTRLVVDENSKAQSVELCSTIPVVCPQAAGPTCQLDIHLDAFGNSNGTVTTQDKVIADQCTVSLKPSDWNATSHKACTSFKVLATRDFKRDGDKTTLIHFEPIFSGNVPKYWRRYQIPYIQVLSRDKQTSECQCVSDPHCKTMDDNLANKNTYMTYYLKGEFIMYRSTQRPFEVQVRTWSCGAIASCNCGVAAREGNDIMILDMCHGSYGKSFPRPYIVHEERVSHGMVFNKSDDGNQWIMSFPSGAQVLISNNNGNWLDVTVRAPEDDWGATEGLCGTFNGDPTDDLRYQGTGQIDKYPDAGGMYTKPFLESWRIHPIGSSIFDQKDHIPVYPNYNPDIYYCKCNGNAAQQQVECQIDNRVDHVAVKAGCTHCSEPLLINGKPNMAAYTPGRRRRQSSSTVLPDAYPRDYHFDYGIGYQPTLRDFPTVNGKTRADAERTCTAALEHNPTLRECKTRAGLDFTGEIDLCIEDFKVKDELAKFSALYRKLLKTKPGEKEKYFDDGEYVRSAVHTAIRRCIFNVLRDVSMYDKAGNPPAFVTDDLCPEYDCSEHGTCVHGACHCDHGFTGNACQINEQQPPALSAIASSNRLVDFILCDVDERLCHTAYVYGNNLYNNQNLTCRVAVFEYDDGAFTFTGQTFQTKVEFRSMYDVGCKLPTQAQLAGRTVVQFNISVTNDGYHYSNPVSMIRVHPVCFQCRHDGTACSIKANTCLIDGICYTMGAVNPAHRYHICDMSASATSSRPSLTPTTTREPVYVNRQDIWTFTESGCVCDHDSALSSCACCEEGGCHCPLPHQTQCTLCGNTTNCGTPQPSPEFGMDGYTRTFTGCTCAFNVTRTDCACCQSHVHACQCGIVQRNQCVHCQHMERCGTLPVIFGAPAR